jgi:hypothetical protein
MPTQASGNMPEDDVAIVELDRKRRARKNLSDMSEYLDRRFLDILRGFALWYPRTGSVFASITNSYG